ncbi:MAG: helix-turn-helix domain-containing protein [Halothece sp.]
MNEETSIAEFIESSGNIFADLALENAEELLIRAKLGYALRKLLENRQLKQEEIASLLEIDSSEALDLMQGKYHLFSAIRLFSFFNKLEQKITIQISDHRRGEPLMEVRREN